MSGHGRYVCQFGIMHMQCRCMENHKIIRMQCDVPDEHSKQAEEDDRELLNRMSNTEPEPDPRGDNPDIDERPQWPPVIETKEDPISDYVNDPLREMIAEQLELEVGTQMIWGKPWVGATVHYVSYGTPGGEYSKTCRAATITEVGAWVTVHTLNGVWGNDPATDAETGTDGLRTLLQSYDKSACHLHVANPTGQFFNMCKWDQNEKSSGTWHWSEQECRHD